MLAKLINYFKGTKVELTHVKWPTRKQVVNFTILVIAISLLVALFLGLFDIIFSYLIGKLII
jgi:preprotein translocase subunit SecE